MLFQQLSQRACWRWSASFEEYLKYDLLSHIFNENAIEFFSYNKEEYLSIFTNDTKAILDQYMMGIVDTIKSILMMIVYFIFMINKLGIFISVIMCVACLLALLLPKLASTQLSFLNLTYINSLANFHRITSDLLTGFIHTNQKTKSQIMSYFSKVNKEVKEKTIKMGDFKSFTIVFNGLVMYLLDIIAFSSAGLMLLLGKYTIGQANAAMSYMKQFIWPIRYIINDLNEINATKEIVLKLEKILEREMDNNKIKKNVEVVNFENVSIQLEDFNLKPIHLSLKLGKKYALIGPSGSGKSTLFNLLTKQLTLSSGEIKIDECTLNAINISQLIGGVYPNHHIYATDALNNITLFHTYSLNKLNSYLEKFPNPKVNVLLNIEDCSLLSQGEKQMIEILRVFTCDSPIVLLDEAFNAIDIHNRSYFLNMILNQKDKIIIFITHDLEESLLTRFDQIIQIEDGQIKQ